MVWEEIVPISEEMYITSGPAMHVCRAFGLFPVIIHKDGSRLFLKWSPLCAAYSYSFGLVVIILTYWGYMSDVLIGREKSIRMRAEADIYVTFTDVSASVLVHAFGIFLSSLKYSVFCKYVQCFNKVDKIIPPKNLKSARHYSIFIMIFIIGGLFVVLLSDMLMYFKSAGPRTGNMFIVKCYTAYYVAYLVAYCHKYLFWHLTTCVLRRMELLNEHLENEDSTRENVRKNEETSWYIEELFNRNQIINGNINRNSNFITNLMQAYGNLCDAGEHINELLGINMAITLVGILWHLILIPYFLITGITRDNKGLTFALMQALWIFISVGRLMFIVQPCYNCATQVQKTKNLVCKLIVSPNTNKQRKLQLENFSRLLKLRKIDFSASGLSSLDRTLVASMVASAATHLVVLLEAGGWEPTVPEYALTNTSEIFLIL